MMPCRPPLRSLLLPTEDCWEWNGIPARPVPRQGAVDTARDLPHSTVVKISRECTGGRLL